MARKTTTKKTTKKAAASKPGVGDALKRRGRRKDALPEGMKSPESFIGHLIGEVVFNGKALAEADGAIRDYCSGLDSKQKETLFNRVNPLTSRLVSVAPALASMFSSNLK